MHRLLRRGLLMLVRGVLVDPTCRECCDSVCARVYIATSCIPSLPPVTGCAFARPPDIAICTDTLCEATGKPVQPGNVVLVNGQCYLIQPGDIPRSQVPPEMFLYDLPTVPCHASCEEAGCIPVSPFSLAEPCDPERGCRPLYFCRSQFNSCRVIEVRRLGGGPTCCYRFDPTFPPALPPSNSVVCPAIVNSNIVTIGASCNIINFGAGPVTIGTDNCCACEAVCDYHEVIPGGGVLGGIPMCDPPTLSEICCPTVLPQTRINVNILYSIINPPGSFSGGPQGYGNVTTTTGQLQPGACPGVGCSSTPFCGTLTVTNIQGPLGSGVTTVTPQDASACFCPLTMEQIQLPPGSCGCPGDPCCPNITGFNGCDTEYICECLESSYTATSIRNRWRLTFTSDAGSGPQVQQVTNIDIDIQAGPVGPPLPGCEGGCVGRTARADGSDNGGIRIRGGGSRTVSYGLRGMVEPSEWL